MYLQWSPLFVLNISTFAFNAVGLILRYFYAFCNEFNCLHDSKVSMTNCNVLVSRTSKDEKLVITKEAYVDKNNPLKFDESISFKKIIYGFLRGKSKAR